jgi:hypothetical protein
VTGSVHTAFPADGFTASWVTVDGDAGHDEHVERLALRWENEAWTASSTIERERVECVVRLSPLWQPRQLLLFRDLPEPDLWLGTDGHGHWGEMNGAHRRELDGSIDVTVVRSGESRTAFEHTAPIRRLPVDVGGSFDTRVVEIDVETLAIEPVLRTYRRLDAATWEVAQSGAVTVVRVDEFGLAVDVEGRVRRTA